MKTKIYALAESDGKIRYIGKTSRSLSQRFSGHLHEARKGTKGYKNNWIRSLLKQGLIPSVIKIGEVDGDGCQEEIAWIKYFRDEGILLVNQTDGGEGTSGHKVSLEFRKKISEINKKWWTSLAGILEREKKRLMLIGNIRTKGFIPSKESRLKMSMA